MKTIILTGSELRQETPTNPGINMTLNLLCDNCDKEIKVYDKVYTLPGFNHWLNYCSLECVSTAAGRKEK